MATISDPPDETGETKERRGRARNARPALVRAGPGSNGNSAAALIYQTLRRDIVSLHRKPGDPIIEKDLAATFGVSRTPIREALLRLATEQLVEIAPQSGTFVARIPLNALPEAIVIRRALEEFSVKSAAENASRSQIALLEANLERQRETVAAEDQDAFHEADEDFHATIAESAGYPGIWTVVQQVKLQVDRYRHLTLPQPGRMARLVEEHADIVHAIRDHDPSRAVVKLGIHLDGLVDGLDEFPGKNPSYFYGDVTATRKKGGS
ncbi:GntR family transcriptional regulator [Telmatospirillum siberiense]|uniref:GntR family transcriptional regulator n=1 Tax=Telmatospirillum siberiense TaxID=382514 RepID=A0A2N3PXC8_9PROT|nr:GntR family transcriptional regulator [Telmatospirillum siberiense]PKU25062.1 GntR family transcriptional regulator [Telmatospirillum siberiense]